MTTGPPPDDGATLAAAPGRVTGRCIFISYPRADARPLATQLRESLKNEGYEPWLDDQIPGGEDWLAELQRQIRSCDVMAALITRRSIGPGWCIREQLYALNHHKRLIPLSVQPIEAGEIPLHMVEAQLVDFTEPTNYARDFARLLDAIRHDRGITDLPAEEAARPQPRLEFRGVGLASWADVQALADQQKHRYFEDMTAEPSRTYDPAVHVPRAQAEEELSLFLAGSRLALALVGASGIGKTSLLCHWAELLRADGHAVLFYRCAGSMADDVRDELADDLPVDSADGVPATLGQVERLAAAQGKRFILIFDGINEAAGGAERVIRDLDGLVGSLPGANVRVVLSCGTPAWALMQQRQVVEGLHWSRFHRPRSGEQALALGELTPTEFAAAFEAYRKRYGLHLELAEVSAPVQEVLHSPVLLRLFAETHTQSDVPVSALTLEAEVLQAFYERRVRRPEDAAFLGRLAAEMLAQRRGSVALEDFKNRPELSGSFGADSSYPRLLELGILVQSAGSLFTRETVRFAQNAFGAYALVRALPEEVEEVVPAIGRLLPSVDRLPLAWDAARILLQVRGSDETYLQLAGVADVATRELVGDALRRLHITDPEKAQRLLKMLIDLGNPRSFRCALKAAYLIGPATRDLFLQAARTHVEELRDAAMETLYLIWRQGSPAEQVVAGDELYLLWRRDPKFTYALMDRLLDEIQLSKLALEKVQSRDGLHTRLLEFLIQLSITIYINHCHEKTVVSSTAALYRRLAVDRLHLDWVQRIPGVEAMFAYAVRRKFAQPILRWMLVAGGEAGDGSMKALSPHRDSLRTLATALDPSSDLTPIRDCLQAMLGSGVVLCQGAAALVLAVHSLKDFASVRSFHLSLFEELDGPARFWHLLSFAVLLPDTPPDWMPMLEEWTQTVVREHSDVLRDPPPTLATLADFTFVPLGLAYGKSGAGMPVLEQLLEEAIRADDQERVRWILSSLGPVGFYFPAVVCRSLRRFLAPLSAPAYRDQLVRTMATIWSLHFDAVDAFLRGAGIAEAIHRDVAAAADASLVEPFLYLFGFYNNAVHQSFRYPKMRRGLSGGALELIAEVETAEEFVERYAARAIQMVFDAGFDLERWTDPEG